MKGKLVIAEACCRKVVVSGVTSEISERRTSASHLAFQISRPNLRHHWAEALVAFLDRFKRRAKHEVTADENKPLCVMQGR